MEAEEEQGDSEDEGENKYHPIEASDDIGKFIRRAEDACRRAEIEEEIGKGIASAEIKLHRIAYYTKNEIVKRRDDRCEILTPSEYDIVPFKKEIRYCKGGAKRVNEYI